MYYLYYIINILLWYYISISNYVTLLHFFKFSLLLYIVYTCTLWHCVYMRSIVVLVLKGYSGVPLVYVLLVVFFKITWFFFAPWCYLFLCFLFTFMLLWLIVIKTSYLCWTKNSWTQTKIHFKRNTFLNTAEFYRHVSAVASAIFSVKWTRSSSEI